MSHPLGSGVPSQEEAGLEVHRHLLLVPLTFNVDLQRTMYFQKQFKTQSEITPSPFLSFPLVGRQFVALTLTPAHSHSTAGRIAERSRDAVGQITPMPRPHGTPPHPPPGLDPSFPTPPVFRNHSPVRYPRRKAELPPPQKKRDDGTRRRARDRQRGGRGASPPSKP